MACPCGNEDTVRPDDTVTIHRPLSTRDRHIAIFYLHGGGLLYGERDDLPKPYINQFLDAGYTLVCADYPLCPEATLADLFDSLAATWRSEVAARVEAGEFAGYFLFGRSAGAYLSLLLARHINGLGDAVPRPLGILDFYGYYDLLDRAFFEPAKAYATLPEVSREQVGRIAGARGEVVTSGPKPLRYALYVHARQHPGAWLELMGLQDGEDAAADADAVAEKDPASPATWSLSKEDIAALPPLFITASSGDEDVPMRISKTLMRLAPVAKSVWAYYLPHDFDRDTSDTTGMDVYKKALAWMEGLQ